jgi:hypothetical protein
MTKKKVYKINTTKDKEIILHSTNDIIKYLNQEKEDEKYNFKLKSLQATIKDIKENQSNLITHKKMKKIINTLDIYDFDDYYKDEIENIRNDYFKRNNINKDNYNVEAFRKFMIKQLL